MALPRHAGLLAAFALLLFCAVAFFSACATAAPTVTITSPADSEVIAGGTVAIQLNVTNFTLSSDAGGAPVTGEGHYHLFLDGVLQRYDFRNSTFVANVADGDHTIAVELAENSFALLGINDSVNITISPSSPRIKLVSPPWGGRVQLNWTTVTVNVSNLILQPGKIGLAPAAGEGHWHLLVDGVYRAAIGVTSSDLLDLDPGVHRIRVELRQNDHGALTPEVYDEALVTVVGLKPSIAINEPNMDAIVWGNSTLLSVTVVNFTLDSARFGAPPVNGAGHYHIFIDSQFTDMSFNLTHNVAGLAPGEHWINVTLFNNDHSPLGVPVHASTRVHVAKVPGISITSPANDTRTSSTSVVISVVVSDFTLAPDKINKAAEAGLGHYHVFVDDLYIGASAGTTFNVTNLTLGVHRISVRTYNNNHTEIPGTLSSTVTVTVSSPAPPPGFLPGFGAIEALAVVAGAAFASAVARRRRR